MISLMYSENYEHKAERMEEMLEKSMEKMETHWNVKEVGIIKTKAIKMDWNNLRTQQNTPWPKSEHLEFHW